jgi:hypothetical protein
MITTAWTHLFGGAEPDFDASFTVLSRYPEGVGLDDVVSLWVHIDWGATLVGLRQRGAVGHLARAVRLADRHNGPHTEDLALRLLAIACAQHGYPAQAATLAGYSDHRLREHRLTSAGYGWLNEASTARSSGIPIEPCTRPPVLTRRAVMDLVNDLDVALRGGTTAQTLSTAH